MAKMEASKWFSLSTLKNCQKSIYFINQLVPSAYPGTFSSSSLFWLQIYIQNLLPTSYIEASYIC